MKVINLTSRVILSCLLLLPFIVADSTSAVAQVNCESIESFGNDFQPIILQELNNYAAGRSETISRRKTLRINRVEDVSFSGCEVMGRVDVTLQRKIRRNAHGTLNMRANVTSLNFIEQSFCLDDITVTSVNLSRTLNIGESIYRRIANKHIPNGTCFSLQYCCE